MLGYLSQTCWNNLVEDLNERMNNRTFKKEHKIKLKFLSNFSDLFIANTPLLKVLLFF